jgi:fructosamine-3-kinase
VSSSDLHIIAEIEQYLGEPVLELHSVGGGCIANSQRITTESGKSFFIKSGFKGEMFHNEASGLRELSKPDVIRVPEVLAEGNNFLLLEYIKQGVKKRDFFEDFGKRFAGMHKFTSDSYGFYEDNFIGATPQINIPEGDEFVNWTEFYFCKRLLYQYKLSEKNGYATDKLRKGFVLLESKMSEILSGSEEHPSLLHGDLWSGNYMCDENGEVVLIDPAVYYGHREADLAMTKLFGGFSQSFYGAYNDMWPLMAGHEYRENIYLLYHVMNHLNLFGNSYLRQAESLLWHYL